MSHGPHLVPIADAQAELERLVQREGSVSAAARAFAARHDCGEMSAYRLLSRIRSGKRYRNGPEPLHGVLDDTYDRLVVT